MIICPNKKNPEVAREFEELVQATSEQAAYHIWSLNNGNAIDRAPNGVPSKLFQTLLEHYNGNRTKAIQAKANEYDNVSSTNYITREDYAKEQGISIDDLDIHDTFVIYLLLWILLVLILKKQKR